MIKIISTDLENKTITYDLYLKIPSGNNSVPSGNSAYPVTWADAIAAEGSFETELINTTTYIKQRRTFRFSSTELTDAARLAELIDEHETVKTALTAELAGKLKFTGYEIADS